MSEKRVHTHYDNLKVARDAPPEVIRAAYKSLSQKYHPDRNPGNPSAGRILAILNVAYDVLSDPEKRRLHDKWIAEEEQAIESSGNTTFIHDASEPARTHLKTQQANAIHKGVHRDLTWQATGLNWVGIIFAGVTVDTASQGHQWQQVAQPMGEVLGVAIAYLTVAIVIAVILQRIGGDKPGYRFRLVAVVCGWIMALVLGYPVLTGR
jgi:hypothetical protein